MVDTVDVRGGAWATTLVKPDVGGGGLQPSAAGLGRWHGEAGGTGAEQIARKLAIGATAVEVVLA